MSIKVAELCTQLLGLSKVGVLKMTAFFRDRGSSWLACVALAFPCGPVCFRSKERGINESQRPREKIGRVIASKPHRNACYADYS